MGIDYGMVGKALAAGLLAKGVGAYSKARNMQGYANALNQGLPQGYQVQYKAPALLFGDAAAYQNALGEAAKRQMEQATSDYYSQWAGLPKGPGAAVKDIYNTEIAPGRLKTQEYQLAQQMQQYKQDLQMQQGADEASSLPALMQFLQDNEPMQGQRLSQPMTPVQSPGGTMYMEGQPLSAQANYTQGPDLPAGVKISPQTLRSLLDYSMANKRFGLDTRKQDFAEKTEGPLKAAQLKKLIEETKWLGPKAKAYIAKMNRPSGGGAGRAPTKVDIAGAMLKNGDISQEEYKQFVLGNSYMGGEDFGDGFGGGGESSAVPSASGWDSGKQAGSSARPMNAADWAKSKGYR